MAKTRIFELKNQINEQTKGKIESKDIQDFLEKRMGVKKTHSSNLEDNEIHAVKEHFMASLKKTSEPPQKKPAAPAEQMKKAVTGNAAGTARPTSVSGQSQVYHAGGTQRQTSQGNSQQRTQNTGTSHRPTGDNRGMGETRQTDQGVARPAGEEKQESQGSYGTGNRPAGQNVPNQVYHAGGNQRSSGQRPAGQGYQGQRPYNNQGQGNQNRSGGEGGGQRPAGQGYQGQRPYNNQGQGNQNRSGGEGGNQRPAGQGYQGQRPYNNQGQGNQNRSGGEGGYQRPAGQGYQGQRPYNNQGQGNQNRSGGEGGYQRPAGQGYQGQRPYNNQGQGNQNRSGGEGGYQRPAGQGYQGQRPAGQGGQRPYNNQGQGNYSRPGGNSGGSSQRTGYAPRGGFDGGFNKDKDEDDKPAYARSQGNKKGSGRGPAGERKTFDQKILDQKVAEKNGSNKRSRDRINKDKLHKDKSIINNNDQDDEKTISKLTPRKGQFIQPKPVVQVVEEIKTISIPEILTIKELSDKMKIPSSVLVKKLFLAGKMLSINSEITFEEAEEIALEYEIIAEREIKVNEVEELLKEEEEDTASMEKRPPVICVMGHVDHGKTSLLDAIRQTSVTSREAGGITQHIGAYVVEVNGEKITFLDTPGHEAFTSMRMRGAQATDIAILVVAADDGVMPQTVEAISHAKAAGVQIIVAVNKIDKPSANVERVKQELTEYELVAEDWGGDTIFVPVSAHTKEGINQLLEMILLTAEIGELKANPDRKARGIVIEAELDRGRGPVATVLVQKGTLLIGDTIAVGSSYGKVRAMIDDKARRVKEATPSTPVEILGLNEVPGVGEIFVATDTEKEARNIAQAFISQGKEKLIADTKAKLSLDGLFSQIQAGNVKELNLIIKADVQGSVEAMKQSLMKLSNEEVAIRVIHGGVGAINESDVILASTSNAIIIGFNVKPDNAAKETADREKIDIKFYKVIYNAIDDVEAAMKGMLDPIFEEKILGQAEVRQTFKASGIGIIAGSYVTSGKIVRGCKARIFRDNAKIYEGDLASLKRFQDDVKEVNTGYECGLVFEKYNDIKEGDRVELYTMVEVPR